jgi:endonuclease YncB( thermonuclease family)
MQDQSSLLSSIQSVLRTNLGAAVVVTFIVLNVVVFPQLGMSPNYEGNSQGSVTNAGRRVASLPKATRMSFMMTNPFQQFETVGMIPKSYFENHNTIYGYTERIIDGDTIRVRHVPGYAMLLPTHHRDDETSTTTKGKGRRGGIADTTLLIRLYGVDCPEISKNKNQITQPFGIEAKEYTSNLIDHQIVKITLLRKDRYGRAVAMVETIPPNILTSSKDLSIELARQGYAELYTGGGFEYNVSYFYFVFLHDNSYNRFSMDRHFRFKKHFSF